MSKKDSSKVTLPECLHPMGKAFEQAREDGSGRIDMICGVCGWTICEVSNPPRQVSDSSASEVAKQEELVKCANTGCLRFDTSAVDHCNMLPDAREFNGFTVVAGCDQSTLLGAMLSESSTVCINTECHDYDATEDNGCSAILNVNECESAIGAPVLVSGEGGAKTVREQHDELVQRAKAAGDDINDFGVFLNPEKIVFSFPKTCGHEATVEVATNADGGFHVGYTHRVNCGSLSGGGSPCSVTGSVWPSRKNAIEAGTRSLYKLWPPDSKDPKRTAALAVLDEFLDSFPQTQEINHAATETEAQETGVEADATRDDRAADVGAAEPAGGLKEALVEHHNCKQSTSYVTRDPDKIGGRFRELLPVPVDDHELGQLGAEMADKHRTWVKTKVDAKNFAKAAKEVTDRCEREMIELGEIIQDQARLAPVDCQWEFDFTSGAKKLRRCDTWEIVREETLTIEERQPSLFDQQAQQSEASVEQLREVQSGDQAKSPDDPCDGCNVAPVDCKGFVECFSLPEVGANAEPLPVCQKCKEQHPNCDDCCYSCPKNQLCTEAQFCTLAGHDSICAVCIGECGDYTPGTAVNECPGFRTLDSLPAGEAKEEPLPLSIAVLLDAGFSRNAAKLLMAGFTLVSYDREQKTIFTTTENLRDGWFPNDPYTTYAQAERALDRMLEDPGTVAIARNKKGSITGGAKHLGDYTFYRLFNERKEFGANEPCRIKKGPNWTTFMKASDIEVILAAWEDLMTNDPKALED